MDELTWEQAAELWESWGGLTEHGHQLKATKPLPGSPDETDTWAADLFGDGSGTVWATTDGPGDLLRGVMTRDLLEELAECWDLPKAPHKTEVVTGSGLTWTLVHEPVPECSTSFETLLFRMEFERLVASGVELPGMWLDSDG